MLFIQIITIEYDKRERSGENMRKINSIRFESVPVPNIDLSTGEYYLHDNRFKKARVLPLTERFRITDRIYVSKVNERYHVFYSNRPVEQHFKPVITLNKDEYGRLVYNERAVTFDGEWYYIRKTINFLSTDESKFRTKLFYRKDADYLFEDMVYLRYCGDYHKV